VKRRRVLAISSGGGHWVQLCRLRPAFAGCDVTYATVDGMYGVDVPGERLVVLPDATRWDRHRLLLLAGRVLVLLLRRRPHVIVTTGAAPGLVAVRLARLVRARALWIDSIANVDEVSHSGRLALRSADLVLTQWPHLAAPSGPVYRGATL
jgi:hypothetical protein